ncbi:uncharacterized protein LOC101854410 [Aplysia californica]|uniref:Uncharacterized protein LOC101854410 n=1 Tax=Aplysia californica TaxID=6500 RepID=A0ABM0ZZM0_APLCA|nr:uncharacterized protein LOC101854410 [Aplysia californica]
MKEKFCGSLLYTKLADIQGSLIAQVKTVINQDLNPNPAGSLSQALVSLSSSPFNISDQQQVPVAMLQVGENINDSQLLLGLAVGLPLFALLLLAVAMATYYYRGKQKEQKKVSGMPQELEFPSSLSPKDIDVRMLRPAVRHSLRYYGEAPGMYHKGEEPTTSHHRSSAPVLTEHTDAQMYEHIDSRGNALRCARPDVRGDNFLEELEDAIYARPNVYRAHAPVDDASRELSSPRCCLYTYLNVYVQLTLRLSLHQSVFETTFVSTALIYLCNGLSMHLSFFATTISATVSSSIFPTVSETIFLVPTFSTVFTQCRNLLFTFKTIMRTRLLTLLLFSTTIFTTVFVI